MARPDAHQNFRAKMYYGLGEKPALEQGAFPEAVEAVQFAEDWLLNNGEVDQAFGEITWNGDPGIHTLVKKRRDARPELGLFNSQTARWPVFYADDDPHGTMMPESEGTALLHEILDLRQGEIPEEKADEGAYDEDGHSSDEGVEREGAGDEDEGEDDEADADFEAFENGEDKEPDADGQEDDEADDGDSEDDDEKEETRVTLFAKFRGPKGWRKRAESDKERNENRFQFVVGKLDEKAVEQGRPTSRQERDLLLTVRFEESVWNETEGKLIVTLPEGVEFQQSGRRWTATVPYEAENG